MSTSTSTSTFRAQLIEIMAERDLGMVDLKSLTGAELAEAENNNLGLAQLYDAITELHEIYLAALSRPAASKPKALPKEKPAKKEKKQPAEKKTKEQAPTTSAAEDETATESESEEKEKKPAKEKKQPAAKKAKEPKELNDDASDAPKGKREATPYASFTSLVTKANKGETDGWDKVSVKVSLDNATEKVLQVLEHAEAAKLVAMKGTEQSMATLLKTSIELLEKASGKVNAMNLTSLLWAATGKKNPFVL
jgi:outer membrane biosynthesis protein TonB